MIFIAATVGVKAADRLRLERRSLPDRPSADRLDRMTTLLAAAPDQAYQIGYIFGRVVGIVLIVALVVWVVRKLLRR